MCGDVKPKPNLPIGIEIFFIANFSAYKKLNEIFTFNPRFFIAVGV